ncbi:AMP-binding protein [Bosea sp. (in: a-proteobacteria)]|jgi:acyl-CoA synthetase (AMP-forming)/AMP-acid ligase II|uniref:AMP-binding protein n=1 Tax=Bosea sp. (in: a-proteobacteria) TaxID=1871050 RepID=UPI0035655084
MTIDEAAYFDRLRALQSAAWPEGVPRQPHFPLGEIAISDHLREWARRQPEKPACIFYGREVSYAELDDLSDRFAALLHARGVRSGDRIAVFLPNCPQFMLAFFAILKLGCVHVPVNPLFREAELAYELNDTGARVIVCLDSLMPLLRQVRDQTSVETIFVTSFAEMLPAMPTIPVPQALLQPKIACDDAIDLLPALAQVTAPAPVVAIDLDAVAALNYTGGTTGMPKGCIHTQRDMLYTAGTSLAASFALSPDDVVVNFVPIFWIAGEDAGLLFPMVAGATVVLMARWDAVGFMTAVERYKASFAYLLVDNTVEILEHPASASFDLTSLRKVRVSSFVKKLNPDFRARWRALTGAGMIEAAWGMTETHTMDTFTIGMQGDDFDLLSQPVFVGLPVPGTDFKICDFDSGALMPLGETGEICVRTPSLFKGYWNRPEASTEAIRGGFLHTGDIGVIDEEGYLHFLGRRKEMLKVKGMSVFPAEIEAMLGQHPCIAGSGVIGREDPERGQVPVAFIALAEDAAGLDAAALAAWCRERMAAYKVPEIRIVQALPMTATGKVKKEELRALL